MKCSLLSYMLEVPSILGPDKDAQGHHRGSSRELYSRDDVLGALRAQQQLWAAVLAGLRPRTPQHRSAQLPMQPIPVSLESFRKDINVAPWGFFRFNISHSGSLPWTPEQTSALPAPPPPAHSAASVPNPHLPATSASAEATASEGDSESEPDLDIIVAPLGCPEEVGMFASTGVVHAADSPSGKTLCGIPMSGSRWQEVCLLVPDTPSAEDRRVSRHSQLWREHENVPQRVLSLLLSLLSALSLSHSPERVAAVAA